ncbi:MAG: RelA/SpoT family protein [Hydrotalea sp.]|nr:RelA/SpoT family protein [Hydrotalea sp.]
MQADQLISSVKNYNPNINEKLLAAAYDFSVAAHKNQKRHSGRDYFEHPLAVAQLLTEKKMDDATIITALLHDTVEDTTIKLSQIKKQFGEEVSFLVDGLTKIAHLEESEREIKDSENLRKLLLASIGDIRVLIVKLADRLHNMRTLAGKQNPDSRARIAEQTLEIYVPLAERIGLKRWSEELASLAFKELHPVSYELIDKRLNFLYREQDVNDITRTLEELLKIEKMEGAIKFRLKDHWSIYQKMQKKQRQMEDLSDIMAFRIVVNNTRDCYLCLWLLHERYKTIPTKLKDYISSPKSNGYQSLHTVIIGPGDKRIEVQIRTHAMDDFAENGLASHWLYKHEANGNGGHNADVKNKYQRYHDSALTWLKDFFTAIEEEKSDQLSFLDSSRTFLYTDRIYVSSPKGDFYELPINSLPLDFAFAVHSRVGEQFSHALVNGRQVSFYTNLKNGDTVEIITSDKKIMPEQNWLHWLKTARAKTFVTKKLKERKEQTYLVQGQDLLKTELLRLGLMTPDETNNVTLNLKKVYKKFGVASDEQLYRLIALSQISAREVLFVLYPEMKRVTIYRARQKKAKQSAAEIVDIRHFTKDVSLKFAECCYPLPGDQIAGVINLGEGLTLHRLGCKKLLPFQHHPDRMIAVHWQKKSAHQEIFTSRLLLSLKNRPGALNLVTDVLTKTGSNIANVLFKLRTKDHVEIILDIEVFGLRQVKEIIEKIKSAGKEMVLEIKRA